MTKCLFAGRDEPPRADAGQDVSVTLPVQSVTLDGRRSSDDVRVVRYQWSQVSGPRTAVLRRDTSPDASVENLEAGTYVFSLTVMDELGQADQDEVTLTVTGGNGCSVLLINNRTCILINVVLFT